MTHAAPPRLPQPSAAATATAIATPAVAPIATPIAAAAALLSAALLAACGGSDGSAPGPDTQPVAQNVTQLIKVVDGPIKGALVCLDQNANGLCDAGEPQGVTATDGTVTLTLPSADANRYPVLALVGTDAVDADHGPVTTAYAMSAPADQPAVVSPLTTLVAAQAQALGLSTADAAMAVQEGLGLVNSPLADYSAASGADAAQAAAAARLVVLSVQLQSTDTAGAKAADGSALSSVDIARAIHRNLLTVLPAIGDAVSQPAVAQAASAGDRATALAAAATAFTAEKGLSAATVVGAVAVDKLPAAPESAASAPAAGLTLRSFSYSDAQNYNLRAYKATAAQNTVVDGKRRFTEYREQSRGSGGNVSFYQQWGEGLNNWARNQVLWTGSAWFACPSDYVNEATPWDAGGRSTSVYCQGYKSASVRKLVDISDRPMLDVVREIRASGYKDGTALASSWGPDPDVHAGKLGGRFPAGSMVLHYTSTDLANPDAYSTTSGDLQLQVVAAVAAGTASECNKVNGSTYRQYLDTSPVTLDMVIARNRGTPCVYTRDEWWGNSTLGIGDVTVDYTDSSGYFRNNVKSLRFSFTGSDKGVAYWLCLRRNSDGSPRNCTAAGSGSYTLETLGDARVLRLAGVPALANALSYQRLMVERQGAVWYGYRSKLGTYQQARLNLEAAQALFAALGMPAPRSGAALTADTLLADYTPQQGRIGGAGTGTFARGAVAFVPSELGSPVGAWSLAADDNTQAQAFFFFADGSYVMADPQGDLNGTASCGGPGYERGSYTWDAATRTLSITGVTLDTNGCAGVHDTTQPTAVHSGTLAIAADGQSAVFTNAEGSTTLYRQRP